MATVLIERATQTTLHWLEHQEPQPGAARPLSAPTLGITRNTRCRAAIERARRPAAAQHRTALYLLIWDRDAKLPAPSTTSCRQRFTGRSQTRPHKHHLEIASGTIFSRSSGGRGVV
jgi:hypothetical protein